MIPMEFKTAFQTMMFTNRQTFLFPVSTGRAILARICGIHFNELAPSVLSFVRQFVDKGTPRYIKNLFGKDATGQTFDIKIFDRNHIVILNEMRRDFVLKVGSLITNLLVNIPKYGNRFQPAVRSRVPPGNSSLSDSEFICAGFVIFPIIDLRTVRERNKGFDADIDPNRLIRDWQWLRGNAVTGNNGVPLRSFALDCDLFDRSLDLSMLLELQQPNIGKSEFAVDKPEPQLVVEKTVKKSLSFESRKPRFFTRSLRGERTLGKPCPLGEVFVLLRGALRPNNQDSIYEYL